MYKAAAAAPEGMDRGAVVGGAGGGGGGLEAGGAGGDVEVGLQFAMLLHPRDWPT